MPEASRQAQWQVERHGYLALQSCSWWMRDCLLALGSSNVPVRGARQAECVLEKKEATMLNWVTQ